MATTTPDTPLPTQKKGVDFVIHTFDMGMNYFMNLRALVHELKKLRPDYTHREIIEKGIETVKMFVAELGIKVEPELYLDNVRFKSIEDRKKVVLMLKERAISQGTTQAERDISELPIDRAWAQKFLFHKEKKQPPRVKNVNFTTQTFYIGMLSYLDFLAIFHALKKIDPTYSNRRLIERVIESFCVFARRTGYNIDHAAVADEFRQRSEVIRQGIAKSRKSKQLQPSAKKRADVDHHAIDKAIHTFILEKHR